MRVHDFTTNFSSEEFQDFARDMIQKREGIIFESFAEGKDQGIDGRYIAEDGTTVILQAKQFKNMASEILKVMRKEKMKMDQLVHAGKRVDCYILALSENVTPDKKDQIAEIMCPYICNLKDIVTKNDFNNWLSFDGYKTIEEKYFDAELCTAAANNDADGYWYQMAECDECYEEYHMKFPESLQEKIKIYETWIENGDEEEIPEEKNKKTVKEKSIEEIQKEFESDFLQPICRNWIDKTDNWMEERKLSPKFCDCINHIEENEHVIWYELTGHEDALAFLSDFLEYTGKIPDDILESLTEIKDFILRKVKFTKEVLLEIVNRLYEAEAWNKIWSQRQLEEICTDLLVDNENLIDDLTEAGLLLHKHHWYRWTDQCLPVCIILEDKLRDKEKRNNYYQIVGDKILQREENWSQHYAWEILYQADSEKYEKYILSSAAARIYRDISEKNKDWLHGLITFLDYEYDFKDEECVGACWCADEKLHIIEVYLKAYVFDEIEFSEKDIKKLQQVGMLRDKKTTLSLLKIEEAGLLSEKGYYAELENLWKVICEWKTEV